MKKQLIILSIAAMTSGAVFAAGAPVANQFSAGQPARAADVNANFQELGDRIDVNATGVTNNASNITTNTSGVAANASDVTINASGVASNASNIATNTSGVTTNASNAASNTSGVAANASNVTINASGVASNASNIVTNASGVTTNASNVATNASVISANADDVAVSAVGVSDNASGISDNASDIAANIASIAALGGEINLKDLAVTEDVLSKRFVNVTSGSYRIDALIYDTQAKTLSQDIQFTNGSGQTYQTEKRDWEYGDGMVMKNYLQESHQTDFEMSVVYTPGLLFLKEKAVVGESWWSIYDLEITQVFEGESAVTTRQKGRKFTLIGLQDVSVPYGDFENCAVIEQKTSNYSLYYYCEGVGLARHISFSDDSFELIGVEGISIPIGEKIGYDYQLESLTTQ